ncbi:MAG: hypothetical protein AABW63_01695 [Nanoarchaeota archaeon]
MDEEKEERTNSRLNQVVDDGVKYGLKGILQNHPDLMHYAGVLGDHIDERKFAAEKNRIFAETNEASRNGKFASEYSMWEHVYGEIAKVVASGKVFDKIGTRTILEGGLAEIINKSFFVGGARNETKERTELDDILEANGKILDIMSSKQYDPRKMPELVEAVGTVQRMGVLYEVIEELKEHNLMDEGRYNEMKMAINKTAIDTYDAVRAKLPEYVAGSSAEKGYETEVTDISKTSKEKTAHKVAAAILGIFGVGILIATKTALTGGAIGILPSSSSFVAVGLIIISLIWLWAAFKRK